MSEFELTRSGRLVGPIPASSFPDPDDPDVFMGPCLINGERYIKAMIRVAKITVDGTMCTVPLRHLVDTIDSGGKYEVEVTSMRLSEFNKLEEFAGW